MIEIIFEIVFAILVTLMLLTMIVFLAFTFIKDYRESKSENYKKQLSEAKETIAELDFVIRNRQRNVSAADRVRARKIEDKKKELEEHGASEVTQTEYIALYYGWEAQSRQCIEEMAETTKAINKLWRYERGYLPKGAATEEGLKKNIVEELADTMVCIEQMVYLMEDDFVDVRDLLDDIRSKKLDRAIQRIKDKEENKQ